MFKIIIILLLSTLHISLTACSGGTVETPTPDIKNGGDSGSMSGDNSNSSGMISSSSSSGSSSSSSSGTPIQLTFLSPSSTARFYEGGSLLVSVDSEQTDLIQSMSLKVNGEEVITKLTPPWRWQPSEFGSSLANLLVGPLTIDVSAIDQFGNSVEINRTINVERSEARISSLSLLDVSKRDDRFAQDILFSFDGTEESTEILLDDFPNIPMTLRAEAVGDVESVRFSLNENQNERTDSNPPYVIANGMDGIPGPWNLEPGTHTITATPFLEDFAGGEVGIPLTIKIRLLASKVELKQSSLFLSENPNDQKAELISLVLQNSGNLSSNFQILEIPEWLQVEKTKGTIPENSSLELIFSPPHCDRERKESGQITLGIGKARTEVIPVSWVCTDKALYDLELGRFYFNQAVPVQDSDTNAEGADVKLVGNREGLARAFVTSTEAGSAAPAPEVKLFYRTALGEEGSYELSGPDFVEETINESKLNNSFNFKLPAEFFVAGTEYYVVVDPENNVPELNEDNNRYPSQGFKKLDIWQAPVFEFMAVPMIMGNKGKDPKLDRDAIERLLIDTRGRHPISEYRYTIHETVTYTGNKGIDGLNAMIKDIRRAENGKVLYHGMFIRQGNKGSKGIATVEGGTGVSIVDGATIAHEFGHNMSLEHTDCGKPGYPEKRYPHANARTGSWGYDIINDELKSAKLADFMSYCDPEWVGIWNFKKMMDYRTPRNARREKTRPETLEGDFLAISGRVDNGEVEITNVYEVNSWLKENIGRDYQMQLIGTDESVLYQELFTPELPAHGSYKIFSVGVPLSELGGVVAKVRISRFGEVVLEQQWFKENNSKREKTGEFVSAERLDSQRVQFRWKNEGDTALWIKDKESKQILAIDKTGEVTVYSTDSQFEIVFQRHMQNTTREVEVQ